MSARTAKIDTDLIADLIAEHLKWESPIKSVTVIGLEIAGYLRVEVEYKGGGK